jgi:hypothetical protein
MQTRTIVRKGEDLFWNAIQNDLQRFPDATVEYAKVEGAEVEDTDDKDEKLPLVSLLFKKDSAVPPRNRSVILPLEAVGSSGAL